MGRGNLWRDILMDWNKIVPMLALLGVGKEVAKKKIA
jgi:hypothetical protein